MIKLPFKSKLPWKLLNNFLGQSTYGYGPFILYFYLNTKNMVLYLNEGGYLINSSQELNVDKEIVTYCKRTQKTLESQTDKLDELIFDLQNCGVGNSINSSGFY